MDGGRFCLCNQAYPGERGGEPCMSHRASGSQRARSRRRATMLAVPAVDNEPLAGSSSGGSAADGQAPRFWGGLSRGGTPSGGRGEGDNPNDDDDDDGDYPER
ncbi:hypothetical protein HPB47_021458 [Ixodes persulcatus]|uniref:Uncharacterized protein n=1 Tax=Ixodes persulcatus TaxID=34615 RepID=A0AC60QCQ0_IXOPE|nr:hypothetical protein HPB47_021458 [Ixodes persulcatus]